MESKKAVELLALLALIEGGTVDVREVLRCARRGIVPLRRRKTTRRRIRR